MEAKPGQEAALRTFYVDILGLEPADGEEGMVCFQTGRLRLRILITPEAIASPMRRRLVLEISSLQNLREKLDELAMAYEWYEGFAFTERRIFVLDPAENRIELKQVWIL